MKELQIYQLGPLFEEVQLANTLGDGKTFPDCLPLRRLEQINQDYLREKGTTGFSLKTFVQSNFNLPKAYTAGFTPDPNKSASQHIESLWGVLTRQPEDEKGSLIPLPHPYVVPGGRFREIYYWDSYFTMLGLQASGHITLMRNMIDNFSYLLDRFGYIPNGNRTYFLGRSQPPFYSLMIKLLQESAGDDVVTKYLPELENEYHFWMKGSDSLSSAHTCENRVVRMKNGTILNRYWDAHATPRPEAYKEDIELSHQSDQKPESLFRHLRAAAESGWDFSSRWFRDGKSFGSIHTTDIIPVDLNCLLLHLEQVLAEAYRRASNDVKSLEYLSLSKKRKTAILNYCWNEKKAFFFDFDFVEQKQKESLTLAAAFPLFFEIASPHQAAAVSAILRSQFLKPSGLTTTLESSGQQWDAPNGWAPLQWVAYKGLLNYDHLELAAELKTRWTHANIKVYESTGKMTEKYDVWNSHAEASGGEYPNQDGFGWTNGVFLAMLKVRKLQSHG